MTPPDEPGATVWQETTGSGPHLVLVHGTMDRSSSFGRMLRALDGYSVTRYDRRGYARSLAVGPPTSFDDQVADLVTVIGDRPALVLGHSYGGTVAVAAAERHPALVLGVVAYESPMPWMPWWPTDSAGSAALGANLDPADAAEAFMVRMIGADRWRRLPLTTRAARRAEGVTLRAELAQVRAPNPAAHDPARVAQPVIAAHGDESAPHHIASAQALAELALVGSVRVIVGAGHGAHLTHVGEMVALVELLAATVRGR